MPPPERVNATRWSTTASSKVNFITRFIKSQPAPEQPPERVNAERWSTTASSKVNCIKSFIKSQPAPVPSPGCVNATRWSTTPSPKVNLHHAINLRALSAARLVTLRSNFRPNKSHVLHRVARPCLFLGLGKCQKRQRHTTPRPHQNARGVSFEPKWFYRIWCATCTRAATRVRPLPNLPNLSFDFGIGKALTGQSGKKLYGHPLLTWLRRTTPRRAASRSVRQGIVLS